MRKAPQARCRFLAQLGRPSLLGERWCRCRCRCHRGGRRSVDLGLVIICDEREGGLGRERKKKEWSGGKADRHPLRICWISFAIPLLFFQRIETGWKQNNFANANRSNKQTKKNRYSNRLSKPCRVSGIGAS